MKILHYFLGPEPLHYGGLLKYAHDLAAEQSRQGHDVRLLMPGYYSFLRPRCRITSFGVIAGIPVDQIVNPQTVSIASGIKDPATFARPSGKETFERYLDLHRPDVVHVHSLIGLPVEFLAAAKARRLPLFFTAHDYFGLCPTVNLWRHDNRVCSDPLDFEACVACNSGAPTAGYLRSQRNWSYLKYRLRKQPWLLRPLLRIRRLVRPGRGNGKSVRPVGGSRTGGQSFRHYADGYARLSEYYLRMLRLFDVIICGSSVTRDVYASYFCTRGGGPRLVVMPLTHAGIRDNRGRLTYRLMVDGKVQLAYVGYVNRIKGFFRLAQALERLRGAHSNWCLHVYGDCSCVDVGVYDKNCYVFHGRYTHSDLPAIFSASSVVLVPSEWKETFCFVALEAFSYGIPLVISANVGFKDWIDPGRTALLFGQEGRAPLEDVLAEVLTTPELLLEVRNNILAEPGFDRFLLDRHCASLVELYHEELSRCALVPHI